MYSEVTLPQEFVDHIESMELGVPIRVLNGNASTFVPPPSWQGMARVNHANLDRCEREGLTIVSWGSDRAMPAPNTLIYHPTIPGELYQDGAVRTVGREFVASSFGASDPASFTARDAGSNNAIVYARANTGGRVVWFHCQLGRSFGLPMEGMDMDRFLSAPIRRALDLDADERAAEEAAREEALREERRNAARDAFIRSARAATTREVERHENAARSARSAVEQAERTLVTQWSALRDAERLAQALRESQEDEEALTRGFDALLGHPKVERVEVPSDGSSGIWVFTPGLNISPPEGGQSRYLGRFRLLIPEPGGQVIIHNVDNARQGWSHPHCVQDSIPCWGGSEAIAAEMIANHELAGLFEFLIQYLETYNPHDSYGSHISYWDETMPVDRYESSPDEQDPDMYRVGGPDRQPAQTTNPNPVETFAGADLEDCDCDACLEARRGR